MSIELIGSGISLYVRKIAYILNHKGLAYEQEPCFPFNNPELAAISPLGKIPVLKDDGFIVNDSSVIAQYLEKKYPENPVIPSDVQDFARVLWFEEYSDSKVTEILSGLYFQKVAKPKFFGQESDLEIIAEKEAEIPRVFSYLENQLNSDFIVGDTVSLADFALYSNFINYFRMNEIVSKTDYPKLAAYLDRLALLDSIQAVTKSEEAEIATMAQ